MTRLSAARMSVAVNLTLAVSKAAVGLASGSIAILAEAAHTSVDLLASLLTYVTVRQSQRPADETHPFGHGKFENLSAIAQAAMILGVSVMVLWHAGHKIVSGAPLSLDRSYVMALIVMGASAAIQVFAGRRLEEVAAAERSQALEADALHFSAEVVTSVGVFVGLGAIGVGRLLGHHWDVLDPIAAMVVAGYILFPATGLLRSAFHQITDVSLPESERKVIEEELGRPRDGVRGYHLLRSRRAGSARLVDMHVLVSAEMRVDQAHAICDALEEAIAARLPGADVTIHVEPDDGTHERNARLSIGSG